MPRFFFNVVDGIAIPDTTGVELPDLFAARLEAVRYSGEVLKANPDSFWVQNEWRIDVTDETRLILFSLYVSAVEAPALREWHPVQNRSDQ